MSVPKSTLYFCRDFGIKRNEAGDKLCFPIKQPRRNLKTKSPKGYSGVVRKTCLGILLPGPLPNYPAKTCYWLLPDSYSKNGVEIPH